MIDPFREQIGYVYAEGSTFEATLKHSSFSQEDWRLHLVGSLTKMATSHRRFSETQLDAQFDADSGRLVLKLYVVTSLRLTRYRVKVIQDRNYKSFLMMEADRWKQALRSQDLGIDVHLLREQLKASLRTTERGCSRPASGTLQADPTSEKIPGIISGKVGNTELDLTGHLSDRYVMHDFPGVRVRPRRKGRFIDLVIGKQVERSVIRVAVKDLDKMSRLMLQHRGDEGSLVCVDLEVGVRTTNPKDRVGIVHRIHGMETFRCELLQLASGEHRGRQDLEDALAWTPSDVATFDHLASLNVFSRVGVEKATDCANEPFSEGLAEQHVHVRNALRT
jgi:hypothetical protein